jgi:SPP1 family predicted phage head-tail adaptor
MRAGELDRRITIEQNTGVTRDTDGAEIENWPTFATVWAKQEDLGGSEGETGEGRTASATVQWTIYYSAEVAALSPTKFRINEGGVLYDITRVDDSKKRQGELILITRQRGA